MSNPTQLIPLMRRFRLQNTLRGRAMPGPGARERKSSNGRTSCWFTWAESYFSEWTMDGPTWLQASQIHVHRSPKGAARRLQPPVDHIAKSAARERFFDAKPCRSIARAGDGDRAARDFSMAWKARPARAAGYAGCRTASPGARVAFERARVVRVW